MSTNIEWTKGPDGSKGKTWPVVTGCSHAGSPGCDNCYAARMAATRLKHHPRYAGLAVFENGKARWTGKVRLNRDVLEQPLHWKKPRRVFVVSMGDLFHKDVGEDFLIDVFVRMGEAPQHTFQILTKRPVRMCEFISKSTWGMSPLSNVWLGVSVENQAAADERIPLLLQTPAAVRFVSVEPMLGAVNITDQPWWDWRYTYDYYKMAYPDAGPPIDWVICGGESGPGARPMHPDWARSLRDQCQISNTPYFFKQWGAWGRRKEAGITLDDGPFGYWDDSTPGYNEWVPGGFSTHGEHMVRIGKKAAGHLLDGRAWQEFPVADGAGAVAIANKEEGQ